MCVCVFLCDYVSESVYTCLCIRLCPFQLGVCYPGKRPCSFTWLYNTDAQQVGGTVGDSAQAAVVVSPPQDGRALIGACLAAPCPRHRQPEVSVDVRAVHGGAGAESQQLLAPLQGALVGERHQVFELALAFVVRPRSCRLEAPGDRGGDVRVMAGLDQAQEVEGVSEGHAGSPR